MQKITTEKLHETVSQIAPQEYRHIYPALGFLLLVVCLYLASPDKVTATEGTVPPIVLTMPPIPEVQVELQLVNGTEYVAGEAVVTRGYQSTPVTTEITADDAGATLRLKGTDQYTMTLTGAEPDLATAALLAHNLAAIGSLEAGYVLNESGATMAKTTFNTEVVLFSTEHTATTATMMVRVEGKKTRVL